ncbi:MAG: hypothetical protein Q4F37_05415 [Corynebacterium sp.]|nr:hypothetical protein [Corynebacterium sp.]
MNLRKGLIAAATALTVSAAGVGVASAETTPPTTPPAASSSSLIDKDKDNTGEPKGSSLSSVDEDKTEEDPTLSSTEGLEELSGVLKIVSTVVGAIATIYSALKTFDIL